MTLRSARARPFLPIPLSILLTLLWAGLVRLLFLVAGAQASRGRLGGEAWMAALLEERVLGRARLPTIIVAISLLLLVYLWLDYRSRPVHGWRTLVFVLAAALLVYLDWAVWRAWWSHAALPGPPGQILMTAGPVAGERA